MPTDPHASSDRGPLGPSPHEGASAPGEPSALDERPPAGTDSRSVLTRPAPPPDFTVEYGPHPDQVADVYLPEGEPAPLILFLHGGFWRPEWDRAHTGPLAADLKARGFAVATIEYRRSGWVDTSADVAAAVAEVPGLISVRAPGPPVVAGHSAGGHLALWVAHTSPVRGVLALAPVVDLRLAYRLGLDDGAVVPFLGGSPDEVPDRYAAASPVLPSVPVVVLHGSEDRQVPLAVSNSLRDAVTYRELPGVDHFALIDPESSAWPFVVEALVDLARS